MSYDVVLIDKVLGWGEWGLLFLSFFLRTDGQVTLPNQVTEMVHFK